MNKKKINTFCPCGSGKPFIQCCMPLIDGTLPASSAEALMRSRYTAYTLHNEQYLLDSWHKSTRPATIEMDSSALWIRLKILNSGKNHVEFVATYRLHGKAHKIHEHSRFIFENEQWFYVDGANGSE